MSTLTDTLDKIAGFSVPLEEYVSYSIEEAKAVVADGHRVMFAGGELTPWIYDVGQRSVAKEPASIPVPDRVAVAEPDGPDEAYLALAGKLGVVNAAMLEAKLEQVLHAEMIPVYDYAKVAAYLDNLVEKRNYELRSASPNPWLRAEWNWLSLRKGEHKGIHNRKIVKAVYQAAIPRPVLLTIEQIQTQLPEARFFVSQVIEVADPFLAVSVPGSSKLFVVERWDEPGFRG